jgi:hypothetical protein
MRLIGYDSSDDRLNPENREEWSSALEKRRDGLIGGLS